MKLLHFLCAFTLFLTNPSFTADESTGASQENSHATKQASEPTPFDQVQLSIDAEIDAIIQTSTIKNFDFIQHHHKKIEQLLEELNTTNTQAIKNIEHEKFDAEQKYQQRIDQAKIDHNNELDYTKKSYDSLLKAHATNVKKMDIHSLDNALDIFTATTTAEFKIALATLKEKHATKLQQLATDHTRDLENIATKQEAVQKKYSNMTDHYYKMVSVFNEEEKKAVINAQIEHIQCLESREFDETYTTATHPSVWSGIGSLIGSTPYSYRANENGVACEGCIQPNDTFIHSNLKKEMETSQSPQAAQSLAMVVWALKKEQAQEGFSYQIGIQNCRREGNKLHCKTIKEEYEKALTARKKAVEEREKRSHKEEEAN